MEKKVVLYSSGYRLYGNLCLPKEKAPAVLMSHGLESSKDGEKWLVLASRLQDEGFASLRFSYRGCGEGDDKSDGSFEDTSLSSRVTDYRAALDFLQSSGIDPSRIGVAGSSFGGMVALAAGDPRVKAAVLMATPSLFPPLQEEDLKRMERTGFLELSSGKRLRKSFFRDLKSYDLCAAVRRGRIPLLIIHGSKDAVVPVADAHRLYECANGPKRLEIIEEGVHTLNGAGHLDKVITLTLDWFKSYLELASTRESTS